MLLMILDETDELSKLLMGAETSLHTRSLEDNPRRVLRFDDSYHCSSHTHHRTWHPPILDRPCSALPSQIDFDKVIGRSLIFRQKLRLTQLVMDQGQIAEFASPVELLRDQHSMFHAVCGHLKLVLTKLTRSQLCRATGKTEFTNLQKMASEAEKMRSRSSA